jgi:TetR/AcrR family transcriptional repressor of nem operon
MNKKVQQKQRSREAIAASATSLLRERGIKASSVMDVMKGAGLTVGGFYSHYGSKDELFVETLRNAAASNWAQLLQCAKGDSARSRTLCVLKQYLSRKHRDNKNTGCLLPSTAPEIARQGEPYRSALEQELSEFVDSFAKIINAGRNSHEKALGLIALMYGALSLSRAVGGSRLSDQILEAGRKLGEQAISNND